MVFVSEMSKKSASDSSLCIVVAALVAGAALRVPPLNLEPIMSDIAIRVSNLSKCYQIYDNPRDRLKQFVVPKLCRVFPPLRKFFTSKSSSSSSPLEPCHLI